jgi:putative oxidoreductase
MELGLLALRVVVGLLFVGHGSQKLFGAFGGHGIEGTGQFFEQLGMRPGRRNAFAAGVAEALGGALLVLGLLTPLAAAMLIAVMVVAIATVHASKGVWSTEGGYEYNLVLATVAFAIACIGAGHWSLDNALNLGLHGESWGLGAAAAGVFGALGALAAGRMAQRAEDRRRRGGARPHPA